MSLPVIRVRLTYLRIQDRRKYNPGTSKFQDARRKLSTVSECNGTALEALDLESKLNHPDSEPECPICIGPLFVSSNRNAAEAVPKRAIPLNAPGSDGDHCVPEGSGGEPSRYTVGGSSDGCGVKAAPLNWSVPWPWKRKSSKPASEPSEDDILTLRNCQHAFHAKCLSSWFLIERFDCPVCRSQYWQTRENRARAATAPPVPVPAPEDGSVEDGSGITPPVPARLVAGRMAVRVM
ncbi:hypothetical protein CORC01_02825 [Colletotrichum orchidophilum]|uniref:RING-type domain-containing protein n=1 Tax=Colletotrichum orchidophilum TaxID=1209926 RepID=A0A1G4BKX1_9PEZI|nr:uncharacterized protein CORC01_02825 [Colletotrichum orchidophilum]OHF01947.1 hypothetical protein CORC01_02825 [Colletotrichum orchidophilum]